MAQKTNYRKHYILHMLGLILTACRSSIQDRQYALTDIRHVEANGPDSIDVYLALTSYPPGDRADEAQLAAFRDAIAEAFRVGDGVLEVEKETGLLISRKVA